MRREGGLDGIQNRVDARRRQRLGLAIENPCDAVRLRVPSRPHAGQKTGAGIRPAGGLDVEGVFLAAGTDDFDGNRTHHKKDFCSPSNCPPFQSVTRQATSEPKFLSSSPSSFSEVQLRKNPGVTSCSKTVWRGRPCSPMPRNSARSFNFAPFASDAFHRTSKRMAEISFVCWRSGLISVAVKEAGRNRVAALEIEIERQDFDDAARPAPGRFPWRLDPQRHQMRTPRRAGRAKTESAGNGAWRKSSGTRGKFNN